MRVAILRPQADAELSAGRLAGLGHEAVLAPVTAIRPTGAPLPEGDFAALVLTSAHAIPFCGGLAKDIPVFAVGARTAAAARAAGFSAVRDGGGDAARLARAIRQTLPDDAPLLHAAGRDRKAEPGRSLAESGRAVAVWECYAAESVPALPEEAVSALRARPVDAVLHYSRRSAAIAADLFAKAGLGGAFGRPPHLCLSADIAAALAGRRVLVAAEPREAALFRLLEELRLPATESPPRSR